MVPAGWAAAAAQWPGSQYARDPAPVPRRVGLDARAALAPGRRTVAEHMIGSLAGAVPRIHPQAWVAPGAVVVGNVNIGRSANIWYGCVLRADEDEIVVGAECNIQDLCCLHVDPGEPVVLE